QQRLAEARSAASECLHLNQELGDLAGQMFALTHMGFVATTEEDFPAASSWHEQSLRLPSSCLTRRESWRRPWHAIDQSIYLCQHCDSADQRYDPAVVYCRRVNLRILGGPRSCGCTVAVSASSGSTQKRYGFRNHR